MTECKSWKTAIRRFFKSLTDYPEFNGWQDGILESCENGQGRKEKKKMKRYSLYFTSKSRYKKALSLMYKKPSIYNEIVGGLSGSKQYYISWRMQ